MSTPIRLSVEGSVGGRRFRSFRIGEHGAGHACGRREVATRQATNFVCVEIGELTLENDFKKERLPKRDC